jgi:hypothetical protein
MWEREHDPEVDLEQYLRTLQPRAIRPWEMPRRAVHPWWPRLAPVAALILVGSVALWYAQPLRMKPPEPSARHDVGSTIPAPRLNTIPALTKLALDDDQAFDRLLTDESRTAFPVMHAEPSALRVLAKE